MGFQTYIFILIQDAFIKVDLFQDLDQLWDAHEDTVPRRVGSHRQAGSCSSRAGSTTATRRLATGCERRQKQALLLATRLVLGGAMATALQHCHVVFGPGDGRTWMRPVHELWFPVGELQISWGATAIDPVPSAHQVSAGELIAMGLICAGICWASLNLSATATPTRSHHLTGSNHLEPRNTMAEPIPKNHKLSSQTNPRDPTVSLAGRFTWKQNTTRFQ